MPIATPSPELTQPLSTSATTGPAYRWSAASGWIQTPASLCVNSPLASSQYQISQPPLSMFRYSPYS